MKSSFDFPKVFHKKSIEQDFMQILQITVQQ